MYMIGEKFGRWTVVSGPFSLRLPCGEVRKHWKCQCECGKTGRVSTRALKSGNSKSCGCLASERAREVHSTHGMKGSPEYRVWSSMWTRCTNAQSKDYQKYGARGITICPEWRDFSVFLRDMGCRPSLKHSIDRIDGAKGYFPENCRWATAKQQANNRKTNRLFSWNGAVRTVSELADIAGTTNQIMYARLVTHRWPIERAMTL